MYFEDRHDAGRRLANALKDYRGKSDVIVLGLARGGIPVAYEVANDLKAPLDVFIVRKLGLPGYDQLAVGAIASGGIRVLNDEIVALIPDPERILELLTTRELEKFRNLEERYCKDRPPREVKNKTVILVDDGLATGATMRAAIEALRKKGAKKIVVAVPVGAPESCAEIENEADEIICLSQPPFFSAVGQFYSDFGQTSDEEVVDLLGKSL